MRVEHRSKRSDHETPESILSRVRQIGPIVLDPATRKENPTGAEYIRTPHCDPDGLVTRWREFKGLVFVNPPYGRPHNRVWAEKIASEGKAGAEIVALVAARTGSRWFEQMWTANRICFVLGRIRFVGSEAGAPFDSALCYWGPRVSRFEKAMEGLGKLIRP
jgi:phage N-6-adenine-methyltransferase